jgi:hypothetical protein
LLIASQDSSAPNAIQFCEAQENGPIVTGYCSIGAERDLSNWKSFREHVSNFVIAFLYFVFLCLVRLVQFRSPWIFVLTSDSFRVILSKRTALESDLPYAKPRFVEKDVILSVSSE